MDVARLSVPCRRCLVGEPSDAFKGTPPDRSDESALPVILVIIFCQQKNERKESVLKGRTWLGFDVTRPPWPTRGQEEGRIKHEQLQPRFQPT